MKAYTLFAAGLIFVSVSARGQESRGETLQHSPHFATVSSHSVEYNQKAVNVYTQLLNSDCDGIVESATAHLTLMRVCFPDLNLREAQEKIADLAESGRTPVIRYKAYLATMVFRTPEMFVNGLTVGSTESDPFFREIASRAQLVLLGQNMR